VVAVKVRETWVRLAHHVAVYPQPPTMRFAPSRAFVDTGDYSTDATDSGLGDKCPQTPLIWPVLAHGPRH